MKTLSSIEIKNASGGVIEQAVANISEALLDEEALEMFQKLIVHVSVRLIEKGVKHYFPEISNQITAAG